MKPDEYVGLASTTRSGTNQNLDDNFMDNIHMMLGIMSESGEIADVFKKNLSYKVPIDWTNIKEELGDLMWYIAGFCDINGFSLEEVMEVNINKLKARYPEGFKEADAVDRNLDAEREILETVGEAHTDNDTDWDYNSGSLIEFDDLGEENPDIQIFHCFTREDADKIYEALCSVYKNGRSACPYCHTLGGHTLTCKIVEAVEIIESTYGEEDA